MKLTEKISELGSALVTAIRQHSVTESSVSFLKSPRMTLLLLCVTAGAVGWAILTSSRPPQIETKIEKVVEYKDRIVEKIVEKEVLRWKERVVTEIRPDGTTIKTEEKEGEKLVDTVKLAERVIEYRDREKIVYKKALLPQYAVSVAVGVDKLLKREYSIEGSARIGELPLFVGVFITSRPMVGLSLRAEF